MNATLLVLLSLASSAAPSEPTSVAQCVAFALEEPALFTRRLSSCARPLSTEALLDGVSYEHEREAVTERVRSILWTCCLDSTGGRFNPQHAARRLEVIERYAPKESDSPRFSQASLLRSFKDTGLLVVRAKKLPDAFGRSCAVAAFKQGSSDPVVAQLAWEAWLSSPDYATRTVMVESDEMGLRLRQHLETLRATRQAPRREDFKWARQIDADWVWDELLFWSASPDETAAREATLTLATEVYFELPSVPEPRRPSVRAALLAYARKSNESAAMTALEAWARLAERQPPRAELDIAREFARADPKARGALVSILAVFAADEPAVRPLLFAALHDGQSGFNARGHMAESPGVACWLPAELLPRLRALSDPEATDWYPTVGLAQALVEKVWNRRIDGRPVDEGGGSGVGYCSSYGGGPADQSEDAELFGLERTEYDILRPDVGAAPSASDREKWKLEQAKYKAAARKAQLKQRDELVAFLANPPALPAIHACSRENRPNAHLEQAPTGDAPKLVLNAGMSLTMKGSDFDWVLEAPDGGVSARGILAPKPKPMPGVPSWMMSALPVSAQVNDWYRSPGTYTLSFPATEGDLRMDPWSFPVDAADEGLSIDVRPSRRGPTKHGLARQRRALEQVSVTLDLDDERGVVRIMNGSPDTLLPAGTSWRGAVRLANVGNESTTSYRDNPGHDELAPGGKLEIELDARETKRTGDLMAVVSFVPAVAELPENVVWAARSNSVRRHVVPPRPVDARRPTTCTAGIAPWFPTAIEDRGIVVPSRSRLVRTNADGESILVDAGVPLRGVSADGQHWVTWGERTILVSRDAGDAFDSVPLPDETDLFSVVPMGESIAAFAVDGRAWRRTGDRWVPLALEKSTWHAVDSEGGLVAALDGCGRVFVSKDEGVTWTMSATPDGAFSDLRVADGRLWLAGQNGFFTSADAGRTWTSWFEGKVCMGLSTQGSRLVVQCGLILMTRLGEGLVHSGWPSALPAGSRLVFDEAGRLLVAFGGVVLRLEDGKPTVL